MKNTPGPWYRHNSYFVVVRDANDKFICELDEDGDNKEADANLIAAAPELLEALEELRDCVNGVLDGDYTIDHFSTQYADKVIAKAKGESA